MRKDQYGVAEIIKDYLPQMNRASIPVHHLKTLSAIQRCRTAELGGHIDACNDCGYLRISYNSCRNRHCPKCQGLNKEMWIIQQEDMMLPIVYYHVVFTLPDVFNLLCMYNPRKMYDLLFAAAWHTLKTLAADPQWIGASTAATMVLHTWSQNLCLHPHLHCIVPNGGLNNGKWQFPKKGKDNFLFPVLAMNQVFKGYFMEKILDLIKTEQLIIPENYYKQYKGKTAWRRMLYRKDWVVFTKKPFSKSQHVIDYLGRYSHRVAITDVRIIGTYDGFVYFSWKDYKDQEKKKIMRLKGTEFIRRFCLHILPPRYRKIRQYGLTSNASKAKSLALASNALGIKMNQLLSKHERKALALFRLTGTTNMDQCPHCKKGKMEVIFGINKNRPPPPELLQKIKNQNSK